MGSDVLSTMQRKLTAKQQMSRMRQALQQQADLKSAALAQRLDECAVRWNGRYECRSPACWHCRRRYINRERRVVGNWFGHLKNENLGFMSVVVGATSEVSDLTGLIHRSRDKTRKAVGAFRKRSPSWNDVYLAGWHEVDAVCADQIPLLPPKRRALIESIAPLSYGSNAPAWIGTWHGIIHLGPMQSEEVAYDFGQRWNLPNQVHVRKFDEEQPIRRNLDRITSYANKFDCSVKLRDGFIEAWPASWAAEFFGWLQDTQRNPFELMRFAVRPRYEENQIDADVSNDVLCNHHNVGMYSVIPTYEYTGRYR